MAQLMEDEVYLNATYITFVGHVELHKYRYLYFILMLIIYIFIICCNSVIIYIIFSQRSLHEPMYIFIAALLMNALLGSTVIYPKLLIYFLSEKQIVSYSACLFQAFWVQVVGCSEFAFLSVMAYDRYVSICKPLKYTTLLRMSVVKGIIIFAWLWPAVQMAAAVIMARMTKVCIYEVNIIYCDVSAVLKLLCGDIRINRAYGLFNMINLICVPVVFIIFTYTRILIVCLRSSKGLKQKALQTCLPHLLVLINFSTFALLDVTKNRGTSTRQNSVQFIMTLITIICPFMLNPILYGLKMQEIYKHLKKLLSLRNEN